MSADLRPAPPELNQVQREAAAYDDGPRLVFAGAGTGKTRVLTAAIAHLIHERSVPPSAIFAATFTNKAAREMRSRVETLAGLSCQGLWIGTFHSLCARMLRREAAHIGYEPSFSIYDEDDQEAVVRPLLRQLGIEERAMTLGAARAALSRWKNDGVSPEQAAAAAAGYQAQQAAKLYDAYQRTLQRLQAMDFDDLLANAVRLLRDHEQVRAKYGTFLRYVLVDEYQDTNRAQFQLVRLLAAALDKFRAFAPVLEVDASRSETVKRAEAWMEGVRLQIEASRAAGTGTDALSTGDVGATWDHWSARATPEAAMTRVSV